MTRRSPLYLLFVIAQLCLLLSACQRVSDKAFEPSDTILPGIIKPFSSYQQAVSEWLKMHRSTVGFEPEWEVAINTPFECGREHKTGILFVHGLGDSPYFFHDIAERLCAAGYRVRTILLPGHGSKPGDMINANYSQWQNVVDFHTQVFAEEVSTLYLAGFSTGTNLTVVTASKRTDIRGLLLFSPAFESKFAVTWLAPYLTGLVKWPNLEPEDNPTRYNSVAMQGFAAYQESVDAVQKVLDTSTINIPTLMIVPEGDSVVDVEKVAELYSNRFVHAEKKIIWMGERAPAGAEAWTMELPEQRIGAASHMSVLFSPDNSLYGTSGKIRICDNGQSDTKTAQCEAGAQVWLGPWGLTADDKIFARLTYNPYFEQMLEHLKTFLAQTEKSNEPR